MKRLYCVQVANKIMNSSQQVRFMFVNI